MMPYCDLIKKGNELCLNYNQYVEMAKLAWQLRDREAFDVCRGRCSVLEERIELLNEQIETGKESA